MRRAYDRTGPRVLIALPVVSIANLDDLLALVDDRLQGAVGTQPGDGDDARDHARGRVEGQRRRGDGPDDAGHADRARHRRPEH